MTPWLIAIAAPAAATLTLAITCARLARAGVLAITLRRPRPPAPKGDQQS